MCTCTDWIMSFELIAMSLRTRTEQSCQTGASLSSLLDGDLSRRNPNDDEDNDYDEVASNVSSLHYQLDALEKSGSEARASSDYQQSLRLGFGDALPQVYDSYAMVHRYSY